MTFGILDDKHLKDVPGTALLSDLKISHGRQVQIDEARNLKRGTGRHSHIVLVPQPSDDPNDPLNWPRWQKEACFWTLAFATTLDGALSPMTGPGYVLLSKQFGVPVDKVASSFGFILLGLACFMPFQTALAVKFGHRPVYFFSILLMFISCIWCAVSPNLTSIRASRVFQGFGLSALQNLVPSTIEQVFFVHERGRRTVIWASAILAGITLGPLIYSYVVQNLSWQMGFWLVTIPLGISVILVFFFVPETTYLRENRAAIEHTSEKDVEKSSIEAGSPQPPSIASSPSERMPLSKRLRIWSSTYSRQSFLKILFRPVPFLLSPVLYFMFMIHALQTVWLSLLPICSSTIFKLEYNFNASQTGLTNLGGLVGVVLGVVISGYLTDRGAVWLSKRNNGVYEPEFRIVFTLPMLIGALGYAGWGIGQKRDMPWIGAVACITMVNFSVVVAGPAAVTYLLDTHGENALLVLSMSNWGKNMVLYGFTFFANGLIERKGVHESLLILAGCQAACWLAAIPMFIYGKRVRSFIARHPKLFPKPGTQY